MGILERSHRAHLNVLFLAVYSTVSFNKLFLAVYSTVNFNVLFLAVYRKFSTAAVGRRYIRKKYIVFTILIQINYHRCCDQRFSDLQ